MELAFGRSRPVVRGNAPRPARTVAPLLYRGRFFSTAHAPPSEAALTVQTDSLFASSAPSVAGAVVGGHVPCSTTRGPASYSRPVPGLPIPNCAHAPPTAGEANSLRHAEVPSHRTTPPVESLPSKAKIKEADDTKINPIPHTPLPGMGVSCGEPSCQCVGSARRSVFLDPRHGGSRSNLRQPGRQWRLCVTGR